MPSKSAPVTTTAMETVRWFTVAERLLDPSGGSEGLSWSIGTHSKDCDRVKALMANAALFYDSA